jgi:hypothetical protein
MIFGALGVLGSLALLDLGLAMGQDHSAPFTRTMLIAQAAISAAQIIAGVVVWQRASWVRAAVAISALNLAIGVVTDSVVQGFPAIALNGFMIWYLVISAGAGRLTGDSVWPGDLGGPVEVDPGLSEARSLGR